MTELIPTWTQVHPLLKIFTKHMRSTGHLTSPLNSPRVFLAPIFSRRLLLYLLPHGCLTMLENNYISTWKLHYGIKKTWTRSTIYLWGLSTFSWKIFYKNPTSSNVRQRSTEPLIEIWLRIHWSWSHVWDWTWKMVSFHIQVSKCTLTTPYSYKLIV